MTDRAPARRSGVIFDVVADFASDDLLLWHFELRRPVMPRSVDRSEIESATDGEESLAAEQLRWVNPDVLHGEATDLEFETQPLREFPTADLIGSGCGATFSTAKAIYSMYPSAPRTWSMSRSYVPISMPCAR